jgi:hypothetical protein
MNCDEECSSLVKYFESLAKIPLSLQLQFLPLLTADPIDFVLVSQLPDPNYLADLKQIPWMRQEQAAVVEMDALPQNSVQLVPWRSAKMLQPFSEQYAFSYKSNNLSASQKINRPLFAFETSPKLPMARLLDREADFKAWCESNPSKKILRSTLREHQECLFTTADQKSALSFCQKEWRKERPVIGEPCVEKVCSFCTEWFILPQKEIQFLGALKIEADAKERSYRAYLGPEFDLFADFHPFLGQHLIQAMEQLPLLQELGYTGHVSLEAIVYRKLNDSKLLLHPIASIKARRTLTLFALQFKERYFKEEAIVLSYERKVPHKKGLLPESLSDGTAFTHQLYIDPLDLS